MTLDAHHDELIDLLNQLREDCLPAAGEQRLAELLQDESLRRVYVQRMGLIADLRWQAIEGEQQSQRPAPSTLPAPTVLPATRAFFHSAAEVFWHPIALLLIVGLFSAGILAYVFSTRPSEQPVVQGQPAGISTESVAKLVGTTDVQWQGVLPHDGDALTPGQRLILKRGSAEIAFNSQARVILVAPAELTIVDRGACRLAEGKLTAHVPTPAKGFQVHTPGGTVTDLGTEFGVVVRDQGLGVGGQGLQPSASSLQPNSSTEVHVFQGKVDVSSAEVGGHRGAAVVGKSETVAQNPTSDLRPPTSTILSAGQAVTISANKIEPLPAADPFKFSPEAFDGRARETLLTDDFEAFPLTTSGRMIGQWKTAYASAEEIHVVDPLAAAADVAAPSPPVGHRAMEIRSNRRKTKNMNPYMAAKVDRPKVPADCRLLIEFDICPRTPEIEPSIQISGKLPLRLAPSIEWAREPDPQAPQVSWQVDQWYRVRLVRNIVADVLREATFERQEWRGAEGWVRDLAIGLPAPKDQDRYSGQVWLGFPAPLVGPAGGTFWLDNVRVEVLREK